MADPLTEIFGRRPFRGTGAVDDYFPEAPDLSYLGRPSFIPRGAGYNPNLDPQGLAAAGFSPRNIMRLQGIRQDLHAQAEQERMAQDEGMALDALSKIDPANRNFSTQLLDIFRKNPRAQQSPNVLGQVELLSRFAPKTPTWSVEDIEDPDVYDVAVKENWGKLSPTEAKRRANKLLTQRQMRGDLAALGLPKADLDKVQDWTQEDYLREKGRLMREAKTATTKPWMDRLSDKEAAAVREAAASAKGLEDFETEFASVQKDNPSITRDAYVKQFKGDPSFADYKSRRLMEAAGGLIQDFGLQPKEAASILGLSLPQGATQPNMSPWQDRTTLGPEATPVPAQPFQTTRQSVQETVTPTGGTEDIAVQTPQAREVLSISERKQPTRSTPQEDAANQAQVKDFYNSSWTAAKGELGKALEKRKGLEKLADDPDLLQSLFRSIQKGEAVLPQDVGLPKPEGGLRPENPVDLLAKAIGKDPDAVATYQVKDGGKKLELMDPTGKKTWRQVIQAWADESLQNTQGRQTPQAPPAFAAITSREAYDALPSGSIYRDSAGVTRRKK